MALWDSLVGTVTDVIGGVGDFFGGAGDTLGGLFTGGSEWAPYMTDSALEVAKQGSCFIGPMTRAESLFSGMNLGGLGKFVGENQDWLIPLGKAGLGTYLEGQAAKDYMNQYAPLRQLSAQQQEMYRRLQDPQAVARATARERERMMEEQMPFLERAMGTSRLASRRRGTPWGASSEGDLAQRRANEYAMDVYGDIARQADVNVQNQINRQLNMLTSQYNALAGAPQYQPLYQAAATRNPMRGFLSRYFL